VVVVLDGGDGTGSEHLLTGGGVDGVTVVTIDATPPRVLDPARAEFYATQGLQTVCPTVRAINEVTDAICATPGRVPEGVDA